MDVPGFLGHLLFKLVRKTRKRRSPVKRVILIMVIAGWAMLAGAQQGYRMSVADIPFAFQVNGVTLPAGQYDFGWNDSHSILVRATDLQAHTTFATIHVVDTSFKGGKSSIVFRRIGSLYFFREIHDPGRARVVSSTSKQEKEYLRMATTIASTTVEVNAARVGN